MPALPISFDVLYWGIAISNILLGLTLLQGWTYFYHNHDRLLLRLFVAALILLDIANAILASDVGYRVLVVHFGEDIMDSPIPWSARVEAVGSVLIPALVQLFFASRVYILYGGKRIGPSIIALCTIVAFVFGIRFSVHTMLHPYISDFADHAMVIDVATFFVLCFASDLTTTLLLFWKLSNSSQLTTSRRTNNILQDLITAVVTRGLLVTIVVLVFVITYFHQPGSLYWTPMHFSLSRIYVITMRVFHAWPVPIP